MISLPIGKYLFAPQLIPVVATVILVPLLIFLGLWQLDRADQKRVIDGGVKQAQEKEALHLNSLSSTQRRDLSKEIYRKASLFGHYDNQHQYLLDNRTYKGRAGFHVLTPFVLDQSDATILINRGWIGYQDTRDNIPKINVTTETITINGVMKQQAKAIVLKEQANDTTKHYPKIIQSIELKTIAKDLNIGLLAMIIELDKKDSTGFTRDWQPYYGSIDKHNAYALQWFAMAGIMFFLFIRLNTKLK